MAVEVRMLTLIQNRWSPISIMRIMNETHLKNVCSQPIFHSREARIARIVKPVADQALWHPGSACREVSRGKHLV